MTRKFLQMGYTRSRRYANHKSGRKYVGPVPAAKRGQSGAHGRPVAPREPDEAKARIARVFYRAWKNVEAIPDYQARKQKWKRELG